MFAEDEEDVFNGVWVNVDFVLDYRGFIFLFSSIYIQTTLKLYYLPCAWVCMSRSLCGRFKRQRVSVTLVKVKVYFRGRSCTWISLFLHRVRGGRTQRRKEAAEMNHGVLTETQKNLWTDALKQSHFIVFTQWRTGLFDCSAQICIRWAFITLVEDSSTLVFRTRLSTRIKTRGGFLFKPL